MKKLEGTYKHGACGSVVVKALLSYNRDYKKTVYAAISAVFLLIRCFLDLPFIFPAVRYFIARHFLILVIITFTW
jgi:hypothetical protein